MAQSNSIDYDSDTSTNFDENESKTLEEIRAEVRAQRERQLRESIESAVEASAGRVTAYDAQAPGPVGLSQAQSQRTTSREGSSRPARIRISRRPQAKLSGEDLARMISGSIKRILVLSNNDQFRQDIFNMLGVSLLWFILTDSI